MNQFPLSHCFFLPVNVDLQGFVSQAYLSRAFAVKRVEVTRTNWIECSEGRPRCIQWQILVKRQCHAMYSSRGSYIFPCQGISSGSSTPFSHHLPRRLHRMPLLTSPPLMPFSIDHYPLLPSPLLASAQSEMPASPWSLLCGRCSWAVKRLRLGTFGCLL